MKKTIGIIIACILINFGFGQSLHVFESGDKFGYQDAQGHIHIPAEYDLATEFLEGIALVNIGCEWGINADFENECNGGKWGFIDYLGNIAIPLIYDEAYYFKDGFAVVHIGGLYGTGLSGTPEYIDSMQAEIRKNKGYTFINKEGTRITPICYDDAFSFSEGLARVVYDEKVGFIDDEGNEVISLIYEAASPFENGIAKVRLDDREFLIDYKGIEVEE